MKIEIKATRTRRTDRQCKRGGQASAQVRAIGWGLVVLAFATSLPSPAVGGCIVQDESSSVKQPPVDDSQNESQNESQKLETEQKELAEKYRQLEEKLFALYEFEKDNNPTRSQLLERAYLQSQEKMTASQLKLIVKLLTRSELKDAEDEQKVVLVQLQQLLELLQSEDRGKRVRDEIARHQEYLKEVERILRIQKSIRGQAEGGVDPRRLAPSQDQAGDRTKKLGDQIDQEETPGEPNNDQPLETEKESERSNDSPGEPEDGKPNTDQGKSSDQPDGSESPGGQPKAAGPSGESSQSSPPKPGQGGSAESQPRAQQSPTRKRIAAAEQRMRDAQRKLEQAQRDDAIKAMKAAEKEIAAAKKELEEILRQLREEEVERTLAMLEGRFRQMLERQVKVLGSTQRLDQIAPAQRLTDFEINAGKLAAEQNSIAAEAARALLLLREDGSSVAFPATVDEMQQDMVQVASRLAAAKVGQITIEIEEDIVDTLNYLVDALVKTQADMERMKRSGKPAGKGGQPGDKPLVDQLAEIKMLKGLQERILKRHRRYAKFLDDPDDPVGSTDDPDMQAALERLAQKQANLTQIARDIVNEKNK